MRLITQIKDSNGKPSNYLFTKETGNTLSGIRTDINLFVNGKNIGYMQYSIQSTHVHIHYMRNETINWEMPYQNVGKLLLEYAYKKSLKAGCDGKVELDATETSPGAFYRLGFRKKSFAGVHLRTLLHEYKKSKSFETKQKIMEDKLYNDLKKFAATKLNKELSNVTFEEAIIEGCYGQSNYEFEKLLNTKKKVTYLDCYQHAMLGIMYLPPEIIQQKNMGYNRFTPIGSMTFFAKEPALSRLKINQIKLLVQSNKLDASNALEIEAKMTENDPRLAILLSPIGLKMMKRNYISGWFIGVYIHHIDDLKAMISEAGMKLFSNNYIKNIEKVLNLGSAIRTLLFSEAGYLAMSSKKISISSSGHALLDSEGNTLSEKALVALFETLQPLATTKSLNK